MAALPPIPPACSSTDAGILSGSVSIGLQDYYSAVQGYPFDIPITLTRNGVDTTGTTVLLRYDPGLLSFQSVAMGSLYSGAVQESADDPATGVVRISVYNSSAPFTGAGVFAVVRFMPHHGTPGGGIFSALEVWLEGDETYHSVVAQSVTAANQLGTVGMELPRHHGRSSTFQWHRGEPCIEQLYQPLQPTDRGDGPRSILPGEEG